MITCSELASSLNIFFVSVIMKNYNFLKKVFLLLAVIRLSVGKLLVNLLQVVKRTNTPLIP